MRGFDAAGFEGFGLCFHLQLVLVLQTLLVALQLTQLGKKRPLQIKRQMSIFIFIAYFCHLFLFCCKKKKKQKKKKKKNKKATANLKLGDQGLGLLVVERPHLRNVLEREHHALVTKVVRARLGPLAQDAGKAARQLDALRGRRDGEQLLGPPSQASHELVRLDKEPPAGQKREQERLFRHAGRRRQKPLNQCLLLC